MTPFSKLLQKIVSSVALRKYEKKFFFDFFFVKQKRQLSIIAVTLDGINLTAKVVNLHCFQSKNWIS